MGTAGDTTAPYRQNGHQQKRPNVLIILTDDMGYSDVGCFGAVDIKTPNIDRLAAEGMRMSDYHTSALCAPTRAMLMTGTDCHLAGCGVMREFKGWDPERWDKEGHEGYLNYDVATLPELLADSGYFTCMSGKWHLGMKPGYLPKDRGFQKSWSLLIGAHNHFGWEPYVSEEERKEQIATHGKKMATGPGRVYLDEDGRKVFPHVHAPSRADDSEPNTTNSEDGFYSTTYFTDKVISFLSDRSDEDKEKPFFAYLPYSAAHFPLQALPSDRTHYRGRYDAGPDALRAERLEELKRIGMIPTECEPHPVVVSGKGWTSNEWDEMTEWERGMSSKSMEAYAAMIHRIDIETGKIVDYLRRTGELDNTVVMFFSDNGAAGAALEANRSMGPRITDSIGKYFDNSFDNIGNHDSYAWLGPRWAQASTAPNRLYKSYSTEGGIRVPMVIRYPPFMQRANVEPGSICHAFGTVMDIAPTILALAGVAHPNASPGHPREKAEYKGRQVYPMRGKSWLPYLLHGDKAPLASGSANGTSYSDDVLRREEEAEAIHGLLDPPVGWEMHGRASLRHGRFKIVNQPKTEFGTGEWQLYDLSVDQGEIHDLAEKMPEKLQELRGYFETYQEETGAVFGPPIRYETGMKSQKGTMAGDPTEDMRLWMHLGVGERPAGQAY